MLVGQISTPSFSNLPLTMIDFESILLADTNKINDFQMVIRPPDCPSDVLQKTSQSLLPHNYLTSVVGSSIFF